MREHKKKVCLLKWSLIVGGVEKQKSSHKGAAFIKPAISCNCLARLALLLLIGTSLMGQN